MGKEGIAIVGMSCRLPKCDSLNELWSVLENGVDAISTPPEDRWKPEDYPFFVHEKCRSTRAGFLKDNVKLFDANFFGISPAEAELMDPQQRKMLELAWEALEDAGIDPTKLKGTNGGVFTGCWAQEYRDILEQCGGQDLFKEYVGNGFGSGAGKISMAFGLIGPCISAESGCSSTMLAVHLAVKSLRSGETSLAIAGGMNLLLKPYELKTTSLILSPTGTSKPFDAGANGYVRSDGGGMLVLKRLSDALNDGDRIWAIIRGSGMVQDGLSKSMGTPTKPMLTQAMRIALKDANIEPSSVQYIEAHATGTTLGDPTEASAIAEIYGSEGRKKPIVVGSHKGNLGHTESSSGVVGIIKTVLAMNKSLIPKQVNFHELNPAISLEKNQMIIPTTAMEWSDKETGKKIAAVNSYGFSGTKVHILLEQGLKPNEIKEKEFDREYHALKISAKSKEALDLQLERLTKYLSETTEKFENIAHEFNINRVDFRYKACIVASSNKDAVNIIKQNQCLKSDPKKVLDDDVPKICFLFTGQGSQYHGMAKELYETSTVFKESLDNCAGIFKQRFNIDVKDALWSAPAERIIESTLLSQCCIFCVEYSLEKLWESWGIRPDYVLGHSLGEFAAAVSSGILTLEDAVTLVAERCRLLGSVKKGKMLAIGKSYDWVRDALNSQNCDLDFAAFNSKEQTVVSGDLEKVEEFQNHCKALGVRSRILGSGHAFHSRHMDQILPEYTRIATCIRAQKGSRNVGYISGALGRLIESDEITNVVKEDYWIKHTRDPVQFQEAVQAAFRQGCKLFVEIGPQPILCTLASVNSESSLTLLPSLRRSEKEWRTILTSLSTLYLEGINVDWQSLDINYKWKKVCAPHYPFLRKPYWPTFSRKLGSQSVNPLLGCKIDVPIETNIYESDISSDILDGYINLEDCKFKHKLLFPTSAFVELCLAAGYGSSETFLNGHMDITLANLQIEEWLSLENHNKIIQMQTKTEVVDCNLKIDVFQKASSGLIKHCKALIVSQDNDSKTEPCYFNLSKNNVNYQNELTVTQFYDDLNFKGLSLGNSFRLLKSFSRLREAYGVLLELRGEKECSVWTNSANGQGQIKWPFLEAMLQGAAFSSWLHSECDPKKLQLPVKIGKLKMFAKNQSNTHDTIRRVVVRPCPNFLRSSVALLNSSGEVVVEMESVELVCKSAREMIFQMEKQQQNESQMTTLWEENWVDDGCATDLQYQFLKNDSYSTGLVEDTKQRSLHPPDETLKAHRSLSELVHLNYLKFFRELGWNPTKGSSFIEDEVKDFLGCHPDHSRYFKFMLRILEEAGYIKETSTGNWKALQDFPSLNNINLAINKIVKQITSKVDGWTYMFWLIQKIDRNLREILEAKTNAVSILFSTDQEQDKVSPSNLDLSIGNVYQKYFNDCGCTDVIKKVLHEKFISKNDNCGKLRILEVGAGTGAGTEMILEILQKTGIIDYEYTYTDISSSFFGKAEVKFAKYKNHMKFKKLDLEEDTLSQGFLPQYYDCIFGFEVVHATKDIGQSLNNLKIILKPGGTIDMLETTTVNPYLTFFAGLLTGYYRFEDLHRRKEHCTLSCDGWTEVLSASGFAVNQIFPVLEENHAFISAYRVDDKYFLPQNLNTEPDRLQNVWLIFSSSRADFKEFQKKLLTSLENSNRHVLVVPEDDKANIYDMSQSIVVSANWTDDKSSLNALEVIKSKYILEGVLYLWSVNASLVDQKQVLKPLFTLTKALTRAWRESKRATIKVRVLTHLTRIVRPNFQDCPENVYNCSANTLWGFIKAVEGETSDQISFRCIDVDDEALQTKPNGIDLMFQELFRTDKELQVAFRNGQRLVPRMQLCETSSLGNFTKLPFWNNERYLLQVPKTAEVMDVQCIPVNGTDLGEKEVEIRVRALSMKERDVFSVVQGQKVNLEVAGEIVRVGENVVKWVVGEKVCTMGYQAGAFSSHAVVGQDECFKVADEISLQEAANMSVVASYFGGMDTSKLKTARTVLIQSNKGDVDLVAYNICKNVGAKLFVIPSEADDIQGKLESMPDADIFQIKEGPDSIAKQILNNTSGSGVDIIINLSENENVKKLVAKVLAKSGVVYQAGSNSKKETVGEMKKYLENGIIRTLPYRSLDLHLLYKNFTSLENSKNEQPVVITMPTLKRLKNGMLPKVPLFNERSTYLITGGLGGIGFTLAKWMIDLGAKHVLLAGRSYPHVEKIKEIESYNASRGSNLVYVRLDIGKLAECQSLFNEKLPAMNVPPIRGVMHLAGINQHVPIQNQLWENVENVLNAKVNGTLNLHESTKGINLEFFVMFSSLGSIFGTWNAYAAGNHFLDAFTYFRRSIGLPAITVNWGQWGDVGMACDRELPGQVPFSNAEALNSLEYILRTNRAQTIAANFDSIQLFCSANPHSASLFQASENYQTPESSASSITTNPEKFWQLFGSLKNYDEKLDLLLSLLEQILRNVTRIFEPTPIEKDVELTELGVDSLMFVEIRNNLRTLFDGRVEINADTLKASDSITSVANGLLTKIQGPKAVTQL